MKGFPRKRGELFPAALFVLGIVGLVAVLALGVTQFEDDFDPPQPGWLVGPDPQGTATWSFSGGFYEVFVVRPNAATWSLNPTGQQFREFCVDIAALLTSFASGEVGLAFAARGEDGGVSLHTFSVFPDGSYRLGRLSQGTLVDLPVTTAPRKLQPADFFNTLRVVAREDGSIEFYGNGEQLAVLEPEELDPTGEIGFFARANEPFVSGRFDFIRIMTPDCEP